MFHPDINKTNINWFSYTYLNFKKKFTELTDKEILCLYEYRYCAEKEYLDILKDIENGKIVRYFGIFLTPDNFKKEYIYIQWYNTIGSGYTIFFNAQRISSYTNITEVEQEEKLKNGDCISTLFQTDEILDCHQKIIIYLEKK